MRRIGNSMAVRAYEDVWLSFCVSKTNEIQTLFVVDGEGFFFCGKGFLGNSEGICEKIVQK